MRDLILGLFGGLLCLSVGAGSAWWMRGIAIERDAAVAQAAAKRTADSLRLTIAEQWTAVAQSERRAEEAESRFVADSAKHLSAARALLARIAALQTTPDTAVTGAVTGAEPAPYNGPTLTDVSAVVRGCLISVEQCGEARTAAEQVADSLRRVAGTQAAQIRADSVQRVADAQAHAIALSRASGRNAWRDVKVAGWTGLALTAGCAVSHFGSPFKR